MLAAMIGISTASPGLIGLLLLRPIALAFRIGRLFEIAPQVLMLSLASANPMCRPRCSWGCAGSCSCGVQPRNDGLGDLPRLVFAEAADDGSGDVIGTVAPEIDR